MIRSKTLSLSEAYDLGHRAFEPDRAEELVVWNDSMRFFAFLALVGLLVYLVL
ncbi:MAG: hypothetical protein UY92_C0004G0017 [Candidatus Magasanikbacteria bacterium GW2011_GWA2_56_11]|uniref:Uncharacterized protein n=1 Tax=Candidatus Magasanikbacteria bacterium GW2011_GWA2_56_11 TaxID=1619044 RepID=A0A0G1YHH6_9BACT|nr:MAG: hypothetical protein UY92_C0004G0017 [Candidatus Magasanikbacteria bacterium GW2011_GWA2_56_11]